MTFLRSIKKTQQHIASAIAFSLLLQVGAQATDLNKSNGAKQRMLYRNCSVNYDEQCPSVEKNQCCREQCEKGCPCNKPKPPRACDAVKGCPCNKPKPPRTCDVVNELVRDIIDDAQQSGCSSLVPEAVRTCYVQPKMSKNVLSAVPTLLRYALEQVDNAMQNPELEKAQNSVEALVTYVEEHTEAIKNHPACAEIMNLLESAAENLQGKTSLCEHMQNVVRKVQRSCCPDTCESIPLLLDGDTVIEVPGNYCLTFNSTGNITISSSNVSLDLNARTLVGLITVNGNNSSVKNGYVAPSAPLTDVDASVAAITVNADHVSLCCLTIECENSIGRDFNLTSSFGTALAGRGGIQDNGNQTVIVDCTINAGNGAHGNGAGDFLNTTTPFDNGGNGGFGIRVTGQKTAIFDCFITTGNGGNASDVCTCISGASALQFAGGNGGRGIEILETEFNNSCLTEIDNCNIITGNGGNGGSTCCASVNGGDGGNGGRGISNFLAKTEINECIICTGNGGNGGGNTTQGNTQSGGEGGNGGSGIYTNGTQITNCSVTTGNGGNGGSAGIAGDGGRGGRGIRVEDNACKTAIRSNFVEQTGFGGNGGNTVSGNIAGTNGNGGIGGDAIWIDDDAQTTEVRLNTLSNTGFGGAGGVDQIFAIAAPGTPGRDGRAVTDHNSNTTSNPTCTGSDSIIYSNFAYAIGNTTVRYLIHNVNAEGGVLVTASTSPYDNVYTP